MPISENIRLLRESHGLNQQEFGEIAGVSDKAVSAWEKGTKTPRMGAIQRIADHFGIRKSDIIEDNADASRFRGIMVTESIELELLLVFRAADPLFQQEAIEMLKRHPK